MHQMHRTRATRETAAGRSAIRARQTLAWAQRLGRLAKYLVQDGIAAAEDARFALRAAIRRHWT
jgi:hypothetical protein